MTNVELNKSADALSPHFGVDMYWLFPIYCRCSMWSIGRCLDRPQVPRVQNKPVVESQNWRIFFGYVRTQENGIYCLFLFYKA